MSERYQKSGTACQRQGRQNLMNGRTDERYERQRTDDTLRDLNGRYQRMLVQRACSECEVIGGRLPILGVDIRR